MPDSGLTAPDPVHFNWSILRELVGDDREFLEEFVQLFREDSERLRQEILRSLDREDAPGLERSAHSLRGMLAHLGPSTAANLTRELEQLGTRSDLKAAIEVNKILFREIDLIRAELEKL